jgi:hypothetical protein
LEVDGERYSAPVKEAPPAKVKKAKAPKVVETPKVAVKAATKKVAVKKSKVVEAA